MTWAAKYPSERLVPYDPAWPKRYAELAGELRHTLGPAWEIEHAGSTSVPGLAAKPVIDLVLRLPDDWSLEITTERLSTCGWSAPITVGDHWGTFRTSCGTREAIGHIFTARQWPEAHMRLFAAWLRAHPDDRRRYQDLKLSLAAGVWDSRYTRGKTAFVTDIVNRARSENGLPPVTGPL